MESFINECLEYIIDGRTARHLGVRLPALLRDRTRYTCLRMFYISLSLTRCGVINFLGLLLLLLTLSSDRADFKEHFQKQVSHAVREFLMVSITLLSNIRFPTALLLIAHIANISFYR